jgi:hypothetical protein
MCEGADQHYSVVAMQAEIEAAYDLVGDQRDGVSKVAIGA